MASKEDKRRIVARNFFTDNRDQYEDYHEALTEFMSGANASDRFVDAAAESFIKPKDGHTVLVRDDGHVVEVRDIDAFMEPRTEMTEDEFTELTDQIGVALEENEDLDGAAVLVKIGWRIL